MRVKWTVCPWSTSSEVGIVESVGPLVVGSATLPVRYTVPTKPPIDCMLTTVLACIPGLTQRLLGVAFIVKSGGWACAIGPSAMVASSMAFRTMLIPGIA